MAAFWSWVLSNVILAGLLAVLVYSVSRCVRNPHVSHGLWLLVLIKLLTPPVYVLDVSWLQEPAAITDESTAAIPLEFNPSIEPTENESEVLLILPDETSGERLPSQQSPQVMLDEAKPEPSLSSNPVRLATWVVIVWIFGALLCGGLVVVRCLRFRKLLTLTEPADESLQAEVLRLSQRMGLKHCPHVDSIDAQIPPLVWGLMGRPRILLPRKLLADFIPDERHAVLAHELAHIRRKDPLIRWIEVCAVVLFWWYPVAWWASRELRRAEEECCDALVIWAFPKSRSSYAHALCKTMEFLVDTRQHIPAVAGGTLGGPPLKRRIEMIVNQNVAHRMSWRAWASMLLVAAITLPIMAQNAAPEKPRPQEDPTTEAPKPPAKQPGEDPNLPNIDLQDPTVDSNREPLPQNLPEEAALGEKVQANLSPSSDLQISSLHAGTILNVHVSEGDTVKRGQILLEVRNTQMEIQLEETLGELKVQEEKIKAAEVSIRLAQATLDLAKSDYERAEKLIQKAVSISQAEYERMKTSLQQAELNHEKAALEERALTRTLAALQKRAEFAARLVDELSIKAPIDGVVLDLYAQAGELIKANGAVAHIVSLSPLTFTLSVKDPEGLLGQLVLVEVHPRKGQIQRFPAKITFVSPVVEPVTQMVKVRGLFKNAGPDGQPLVRPGQTAYVRLPE